MKKKYKKLGKTTSVAEVQGISKQGFWIFVKDREFFLSFDEYPWFANATINQIYDFKLYHEKHLHWPALNVDLDIDALKFPEAYPLKCK